MNDDTDPERCAVLGATICHSEVALAFTRSGDSDAGKSEFRHRMDAMATKRSQPITDCYIDYPP
jgi:hypothetical protein